MVPGVEGSNPFTHPRRLERAGTSVPALSFIQRRAVAYNGVSPSGKARDFDSRSRWFESGHPSHFNFI